ncbi:MAG: hypothetical protein ISR95_02135 [Candidatus Marinimicrobia bacterium]|nr:hypothetical protein [Candidatus Neomarinimicrobiota bacterium]
MKKDKIYIGNTLVKYSDENVQGETTLLNGQQYYKISNYHQMPPFFMSIVSNSDLWMFLSSNGALTAGRRNPDHALFPYYTDDRIHDSQDITGSKTIAFITRSEKTYLWEPFSSNYHGLYQIERNIYKNLLGNHVIFEEINQDLNITFRYGWNNCDEYGFINKSEIVNNNKEQVEINVCDGLQNILPSGIDKRFQLEYSTLVDGYKKSELFPETNIGLYMLSSIPVDRAEPSEALMTSVVWSIGIPNASILLSSTQLDFFRKTREVVQEHNIRARRGAYFVQSSFTLDAHQEKGWSIIADIDKTQSQVSALAHSIINDQDKAKKIDKAIAKSNQDLLEKISKADGIQLTKNALNNFRHSANTLFNIMRGGLFEDNYLVDKHDFLSFLKQANKAKYETYKSLLNQLPDELHLEDITSIGNHDIERYCFEYLPLSFSRRHGDPSRPWNNFSIDIKDQHRNKTLEYQGNWRDIFQNWEALALSFPDYIESMITKFVNASTADGYNPYRVVRDGFDWDTIDPDDTWTYIGYWGDHQIIYLLKLLEVSHKYHPGKLLSLLNKEIYTYANVPYKIKPYLEILEDHYNTVDFDFELNQHINERVEKIGTDGKRIQDRNGKIYHVSLLEKLLVPMLVKFSNYIPQAGIWMNTQRPEWNDANNALVGNGTSMVTLYYLRRYIIFLQEMLEDIDLDQVSISNEVYEFFYKITEGLQSFHSILSNIISDQDRKKITDVLSTAGSEHRSNIYSNGFSGEKRSLSILDLKKFLEISLIHIDHSIQSNEREDHLFNAYNLIKFDQNGGISIRYLYEMLEGQVSILSSKFLKPEKAVVLLRALRSSSLYREDQQSYILYPNRRLPHFIEKNIIPNKLANKSKILEQLIRDKRKDFIEIDIEGKIHFNSQFRNSRILKDALDQLGTYSEKDIQTVLNIYEEIFDHQSFTGRSGTFFKYEGLGSIYWHMVSKLLLAVNEIYYTAITTRTDQKTIDELKTIYYEIKEGIGIHKNPEQYGAFPTDPYSHTPAHCGVQQPGMTGQVKEDYISRFGELGVQIADGKVSFKSYLLDKSEFIETDQDFNFYNIQGNKEAIFLKKNSLAFTLVQIPIIYVLSDKDQITITLKNDERKTINGSELKPDISRSIFNRTGNISKIEVSIDHTLFN